MDDLTAFITARLDEDEAAAHEAVQETTGRWTAREAGWSGGLGVEDECGALILPASVPGPSPQYPHIARHDPARVLRDIDADRKLLAEHDRITGSVARYRNGENIAALVAIQTAVRIRAARFSDHHDYRAGWAISEPS